MSDDTIKIDTSHVSKHFLKGDKGTYPISQQIRVDDQTMISYTDVAKDGTVGTSGFSKKA